jgi:hypothetical protein
MEQRFLKGAEGSYQHWSVVRRLPDFQSIVLAQFSSRTDAKAHLQFLKRVRPNAFYDIVFDQSVTLSYFTGRKKDVKHQDF